MTRTFLVFGFLATTVLARSPWPQSAYDAVSLRCVHQLAESCNLLYGDASQADKKLASLSADEKFSLLYGRLLGGYIGNGEARRSDSPTEKQSPT